MHSSFSLKSPDFVLVALRVAFSGMGQARIGNDFLYLLLLCSSLWMYTDSLQPPVTVYECDIVHPEMRKWCPDLCAMHVTLWKYHLNLIKLTSLADVQPPADETVSCVSACKERHLLHHWQGNAGG